ncbi:MAG: hypothetical protein AMXMBFR53_30060 [Gemmatimonadota bacterium]
MTVTRTLTDRQLEVAALVAQGIGYKGIGKRLGISANTVAAHVHAACEALGRDENVSGRTFVANWYRETYGSGGCVAFFVRASNGFVLIGCAQDPVAHLRALQAASPMELRLVGTAPGGEKLVAELQARFWDHRKVGEWLEPSDELLAEMERLVQTETQQKEVA